MVLIAVTSIISSSSKFKLASLNSLGEADCTTVRNIHNGLFHKHSAPRRIQPLRGWWSVIPFSASPPRLRSLRSLSLGLWISVPLRGTHQSKNNTALFYDLLPFVDIHPMRKIYNLLSNNVALEVIHVVTICRKNRRSLDTCC
jgi:hypothetical protein